MPAYLAVVQKNSMPESGVDHGDEFLLILRFVFD